jgi:signal transduction histidine kinase
MENWLIGTRMAILLYCVMRYVLGGMEKIPLVVLLMLAYICAVMAAKIFKNLLLRRCLLVTSIIVIVVSASIANPLFILLIVVDILELVSGFTEDLRLFLAFTILPSLLISVKLLPEYIFTDILCLMVLLLGNKLSASLTALKSANEKLKNRNDELSSRLDAGSEYESQVRYLSQLEERNSLAQKIHDKVGHTIAGSIIQLEAAGMIIEKDRNKAAGIIATVTDNLKGGMESIRSTLRNIKPAPEQLGVNRLKLILEEFSMNHAIKITFTYNGSLDVITHLQWKIIMDNTKEALTNALKYSAATNINVKLDVMTKLIKTEVRDNGNGALSFKKGMGLAGMEERTENAGGKLILDGSSGFSVITLLPIGEVDNVH